MFQVYCQVYFKTFEVYKARTTGTSCSTINVNGFHPINISEFNILNDLVNKICKISFPFSELTDHHLLVFLNL